MKKTAIILLAAIFTAVMVWTIWANSAPVLTEMQVNCPELPENFAGYRIAQVSDLHNVGFWPKIITLLEAARPDIIVITGDIVDANHTDMAAAVDFARHAAEIAPCYYVTGNHEAWLVDFESLSAELTDAGFRILHNEKLELTRGGDTITLAGIDDAIFVNEGKIDGDYASIAAAALEELIGGEDGFVVLLAHRPEIFAEYARWGADLTFAGHVHGGQVRLPLIGGLYGPDQGIFPKYDSGEYSIGDAKLVVSRGIGNSSMPLRFNNRPEVIVAELHKQEAGQ